MRNFLLSLLIVGAIALGFLFRVEIGIDYESMWFLIAGFLATVGFIILNTANGDIGEKEGKSMTFLFGGAVVIFVIVILIKVIFSYVFFSERYLALVTVEDINSTEIVFNTDESNTRRTTIKMALKVGSPLIGTSVDGLQLSSKLMIDESSTSVQDVNGELLIVMPLDYTGFFKWASSDSIPGYITMSATDPEAKAKLVLNKEIKISRNGYFGGSIERKVWLASGFKQTKSHFEIDDKGTPYYISAVISPEIGFNADTVDYIIVTNAETAVSEKVLMKDISTKYSWIDRVWPEYIIEDRITYYGSLQKGWLNKVTTGINVSVPTKYEGSELFLVKANGRLNWFTGMTSVNSSDNALVSGIIVEANSNSIKPILHKLEMNMVFDEYSALGNIESELGANVKSWKAVLPQPYIIDNKFFWTAVIIGRNDQMKFIKKAYVEGNDRSNVSFGKVNSYNPKVGGKKVDSKEAIMLEISETIQKLSDLNAKLKEVM